MYEREIYTSGWNTNVCIRSVQNKKREIREQEQTSRMPIPPISLASWYADEFTECPVQCGGGISRRNVTCLDTSYPIPQEVDDENCFGDKPRSEKNCNSLPCVSDPFIDSYRAQCELDGGPTDCDVASLEACVAYHDCTSCTSSADCSWCPATASCIPMSSDYSAFADRCFYGDLSGSRYPGNCEIVPYWTFKDAETEMVQRGASYTVSWEGAAEILLAIVKRPNDTSSCVFPEGGDRILIEKIVSDQYDEESDTGSFEFKIPSLRDGEQIRLLMYSTDLQVVVPNQCIELEVEAGDYEEPFLIAGDYNDCSVACGGGTTARNYQCYAPESTIGGPTIPFDECNRELIDISLVSEVECNNVPCSLTPLRWITDFPSQVAVDSSWSLEFAGIKTGISYATLTSRSCPTCPWLSSQVRTA